MHNFAAFEEVLHVIMQKICDIEDEEIVHTDDTINEKTIEDNLITILTNSSSQVQRLLIFLQTFIKKSTQPMKGLIFVQQRCTARILCHVVRRFAIACPDLNLSVDFMTGGNLNVSDSIETLIGRKNNKKVLEQFRQHKINLIIATSVLEEGIDLPECNLVIRYDTPTTFLSYVQTKGRARMKPSRHVLMVSTDEMNKLQSNISEWQEIINKLKEVC